MSDLTQMPRGTKKLAILPKNGSMALHKGHGIPSRRYGFPENRDAAMSPLAARRPSEDEEGGFMFPGNKCEYYQWTERHTESRTGTKPAA
jgi:hypothetical protein